MAVFGDGLPVETVDGFLSVLRVHEDVDDLLPRRVLHESVHLAVRSEDLGNIGGGHATGNVLHKEL